MATVQLTKHLFTFFPQLEGQVLDLPARTVADVVRGLGERAPGIALYVARTRHGGQTWEALRNGLPQEHAYDVVYRHAHANQGPLLSLGRMLNRRCGPL